MKIGFVSMPLSGHLNPMTALARKLQSRGGGVRFFGVPDIGPAVRAANLAFEAYCEEEYPAGSVARIYAPIAKAAVSGGGNIAQVPPSGAETSATEVTGDRR